ncbi:MAG: anhydro-N-acetylmuramic acid kinase [Crocinitomicaceae bacterium]
MKSATVLGLMSGTSLDGLDLCLVRFDRINKQYKFEILKSQALDYEAVMRSKLAESYLLSGESLMLLNIELGKYFGEKVNQFLKDSLIKPDYIASHGHTVFHQPEKKMTLQIGDGISIFAETGIPVIHDFRSLDVALGGQGAPLVPIGDLYLFNKYAACLNFGGIANISFQSGNKRVAYDICPFNMAFSDITAEINLPYDDKGKIAESGSIHIGLLNSLNQLEFYNQNGPKSLGIEWYKTNFRKTLKTFKISSKDQLRTVAEHVCTQIAITLKNAPKGNVLVTGGGAYNDFLIKLLKSKVQHKIVVPNSELIEFKEAIIFAFLGWLRINNEINVLKTVTGAKKDSSSGIIVK